MFTPDQMTQNILLFSDLVSCQHNISVWGLDSSLELIRSNSPDEALLNTVFSAYGCRDALAAHIRAGHHEPLLLETPFGMAWGAATAWRKDGTLHSACLIGPMFSSDISLESVRQYIQQNRRVEVSAQWLAELDGVLGQIPFLAHPTFCIYIVMLHCCLTGEKLHASQVMFQQHEAVDHAADVVVHDRREVWSRERDFLQAIREGNTNYMEQYQRMSNMSNGVPVQSKDHIRQAKDSVIVFSALCTRAAMEGGMMPDEAYSLGDKYIQSTEEAKTSGEVAAICQAMMEDFVHRMHRLRKKNSDVSRPIRQCCDYIESHVEEKLELSEVAKAVGYADYYLSRKFKAEMGVPLQAYIYQAKIKRARHLLATTDMNLQEIADRLCFCSRSHFSDTFIKYEGIPPLQWRENMNYNDQ